METCLPNIEASNKFQALAELDEDELKLPDKDTPITKETNSIKPPPIIIKDKKNWPAISQLFRNSNLKSDKNFNDKDGIKIIFSEMGTYEKCLQTMEQHKIDHSTFKKKSSNEIRAIFEGVAEDFSIEDITNDHKSKGFHQRVVARSKNRDGFPMSLILCIVPESDHAIKNLMIIMDVHVKFEHQRKKSRTGQCYNCQKFGHTAYTCNLTPVCRHCAGQHESRAHPKDNIPNKCSNCNGDHKSNYRGCPEYPRINNNDEKNNIRRPPRPPRPQENNNSGRLAENFPFEELLAALNELTEFIKRRPILANFISLKDIQGFLGNLPRN
ncbi:hypothetical protein JTB14_011686 [Gonioctena quinquepunctata]|nr:hypothetical protein JTB14_011686 [Gonioctena quinquepunctata]